EEHASPSKPTPEDPCIQNGHCRAYHHDPIERTRHNTCVKVGGDTKPCRIRRYPSTEKCHAHNGSAGDKTCRGRHQCTGPGNARPNRGCAFRLAKSLTKSSEKREVEQQKRQAGKEVARPVRLTIHREPCRHHRLLLIEGRWQA